MPIQSSELRHRVVIEANQPLQRSGSGAPVPKWQPLCTRWAAIAPQAGREFWAAKQMHSELTHLIKLRGPLELQPTMRVRFGDRVFDILSVIDVEERHTEIRLVCKEGLRQGS
jgi:SPP1 family predicted phage head-tail adaptor